MIFIIAKINMIKNAGIKDTIVMCNIAGLKIPTA